MYRYKNKYQKVSKMVLEETQTFRVYNRSQFSVEKTVEIRYRIHAPIRKVARGRGMQYFFNMAWLCNCEGKFCFFFFIYLIATAI